MKQREQLSSNMTLFYKVVFPLIWLGGFAFGTALLFVNGQGEAWLFLVVLLMGAAFILPLARRLKRIEIDDDSLYIDGLRQQVVVPLRLVASVRQNLLMNIRPVTVVFREPTAFGTSVVFMPPVSFRLLSEDVQVNELRRRAGLTQ